MINYALKTAKLARYDKWLNINQLCSPVTTRPVEAVRNLRGDGHKTRTWAEEALPQGFTVFSLPASHRRRLRTTNLIERVNQEIKRRTRVARLFPNEASCLRLVSAVLMEIAEEWQTADKRYVTFNEELAIEG